MIFGAELERLEASAAGRLSVHHHLDSERGFLDAAACAALVGEHTGADFYICGPGPYMDTVEAGLAMLGVSPSQCFIERFVVPADTPAVDEVTATESVTIRLQRQTHNVAYQPGDTILETARRGGLQPPFSCELGNCATCMAHLDARIGDDAGEQRAHARRGEGRLGADLPGDPDQPGGGRRLRRLNRDA